MAKIKILKTANIRRITAKISKILWCLVFIFASFSSASNAAHAASLYFSPSSGSYAAGKTFSVSVFVSSADQAMNAASGIVSFPSDKLEVISLSKTGSAISLWVQEPAFSNSAGTANFEGIVLNPGFTGAAGKIITINFKAKSAGAVNLTFSSGSVLANDGKGTNILNGLGGANFSITSSAVSSPVPNPPAEEDAISPSLPKPKTPPLPEVRSLTHPDQEKWYSSSNPEFNWKITSDIAGVSILLDNKPASDPGPASDGIFSTKTYDNLADGIWYLHLKLKNSFGWGGISHFKLGIDTRPPNAFEIGIGDGGKTDNRKPTINFESQDEPSGIDYYRIKIGDGDWIETRETSYKMPFQSVGKRVIAAKAFDKAGNSASAVSEVEILPIAPPKITDYSKELISNSILRVSGISSPETALRIYIQNGDEMEKHQVKSDKDGNWFYEHPEPPEKGIYEIWAEAIDEACAGSSSPDAYNNSSKKIINNSAEANDDLCSISKPSEKITILVSPPAFLKIGRIMIDYLSIALALLLLIIIIILCAIYAWKKIRTKIRKLRRETTEAEKALFGAFKFLEKEIAGQIAKLDDSSRLSAKEKKLSENLKKSLKSAEKLMEKEIKDIEDELK